jgi:signal transduction histidine kinase
VRYRLWAVDADWVDPGARHQAFYTRLPPGHYRFSVIAANNDGVWNTTGATLDFTIPPTFLQSKTFLVLIVVGLCLIGGGAFYLRLHFTARRISQRYEERLAERERIARELHDTLLQNVQALVLKFHGLINILPNEPVRRHVEDAIDRAERVVVESRERIMDLRSAQSSEDLAQRLRIAADLPGGQTKPELRLTTRGEARPMAASVLDEITQIGSEAIRNAVRHSGANLVDVEIAFEQSAFRLVVHDHGAGIPAGQMERAAQEGHYGLVGMCERARRLKGELQVENQGGARIELTVPARQAYEAHGGVLSGLLQRWRRRSTRSRPT